MQSRNRSTLTCAVMTAIAIMALMIGAAATPAMAADKETKGFFVALDLANTQPTGLDQHYADLIDQTTGFQETAIMNNDADFTYQLKVGYSWGNTGALSISYWSFDNDDSVSASDPNNAVYPTVFGGYAYNNGGTYGLFPGIYPVVYEATSSLKASTVDLDYSRPMVAGEKMKINWIAGLRSASWEEDQTFKGTGGTGTYYYDQSKHIKSDAFGVKVGADIKFGFTDHFSLVGGAAFSFLQGNNDATMKQNSTGTLDQIKSSDDNVRGEIRDFDVRAMWEYDNLGFWVGYGGQTWDGLVADPSGEEPCCDATRTAHSSRDSVAFNSIHAGVAFKFGGKK
jgi:hypothetical protein